MNVAKYYEISSKLDSLAIELCGTAEKIQREEMLDLGGVELLMMAERARELAREIRRKTIDG